MLPAILTSTLLFAAPLLQDPAAQNETPAPEVSEAEAPESSRAKISREDAEANATFGKGESAFEYTVRAGFLPLGPEGEPEAEIFHTAYLRNDADPANRPVTFVFNGGPGAASVYLHMGALGPKRIGFTETGDLAPPPVTIEDNPDSWLPFTDLVFIDPVGTGFSRFVGEAAETEGGEPRGAREYQSVEGDLRSIGRFIERWLGENRRYRSPVVVAGESYGGFRAAMMTQLLPKEHHVPLSGSVLISPKFDLFSGRRDPLHPAPWLTRVPSYAATAASQGKGLVSEKVTSIDGLASILSVAETFALNDFASYLIMGEAMSSQRQKEILSRFAEITGLDPAYAQQQRGRVAQDEYARALLRDRGELVGIYDATIAVLDPAPDNARAGYDVDPLQTLSGPYRAGLISYLTEELGFEMPDRRYESLSYDVSRAWRYYVGSSKQPQPPAAAEAMREGLAMNRHLKVWITHGAMDLQTPYFESAYIVNNLGVPEEVRENIVLDTYYGGHMYYMHPQSSSAFAADAADFYQSITTRKGASATAPQEPSGAAPTP